MIRYNSVVLFSEDVPRLRDLPGLKVPLDLGGMVSFTCGIPVREMNAARGGGANA